MTPAKHNKPPIGSRPGTLAIPPDALETRIHVVEYGDGVLRERDVSDPAEHEPLGDPLVMLAMGGIAVGSMLWFRRRGWWD